ncbi:NAD(P)-dependent oxidoreductase [Protaetiibacter sp. SSC-01]|uniref:NAD(P)-dependent oxidoreductase n=1 Tax=Protaetiibacter sp. SSC-01 TaxID=2759943 RepID=UPI001CA3A7E9|nr:NAD(P)-dependent oxidoreductase [Protaetiibacter sp. SSC-01]
MTRVAVVGLGRMGGALAARLVAAGHHVHGADPVAPARERLAAAGGRASASAVEAVAGAEVVVLLLPDSDAVEGVLRDPAMREALAVDAVVVDAGSSDPARTRALAEELAASGIGLVDAPVSGGVLGAENGTLTVMAAGPDALLDRVAGVLEVFGRVVRVGPVGAGHAVKALNNLLSASHLLLTSEAVLAGERFGVEPAVLLEVVNGSSGRSGSSELKWPRYILPGTFDSGFALALMVKDARIATGLLEETGVESPVASATLASWRRALEELEPGADHTEIARWLAR